MKDFEHVIIIRAAIRRSDWMYDELGLTWDKWCSNSIKLFDTYCRPSLKKQSNQNFTILSLFDEGVSDVGNVLPNEVILRTRRHDLERGKLACVHNYLNTLNCKNYIISRLDRDDCLHYDFINTVQQWFKDNPIPDTVVDTVLERFLDTSTGKLYSTSYDYPTQFITSFEKNDGNKIKLIPFSVSHRKIETISNIPVTRLDNLKALTIVHDHNVSNRISPRLLLDINNQINIRDYGLDQPIRRYIMMSYDIDNPKALKDHLLNSEDPMTLETHYPIPRPLSRS